MKGKAASGIMLALLLMSVSILTFSVQPVSAGGTIYIRPDGTVEGTDKIQRDGDVYTFTDNIYDGIVVQKDNIVIDGAGYTLQGTGGGTGIYLSERKDITIKNTEIELFGHDIYLVSSSNNIISGNNITGSISNGIILYQSSSNTVSGNNMIANDCNGVVLVDSSDNNVSGNNIANNYRGVELVRSSNNAVYGNNITNNNYVGIWLGYSLDNTVSGNNITANNDNGIRLSWSSNNNLIFGNNITANSRCGIWLDSSSNNLISGNKITTNSWSGILLCWISNSNLISGNKITNNNRDGIDLYESSNHNTISGNNITANNWHGIYLSPSSNCSIFGNNIANNQYGVYPLWSSYNKFYHNNFIRNTEQVFSDNSANIWDDGYPSGGNYWSDHFTLDDCCGVNQDEPGSDGIVDEPYIIDESNRDNYPLVEPWSPLIPATVDFEHWNRGKWVPAYIELPEPLNVSDIDISTVKLNDTISIGKPIGVGDYDNDGVQDLMVKFDRAELLDWLAAIGWPQRGGYYFVTLTIEGKLTDGKYFRGYEFVQLFIKSK